MKLDSFKYKTIIGIGFIWIFHFSAIVGVALGFQEWFIPKTPINLLVQLFLLGLLIPIHKRKQLDIFALLFLIGFTIEVIGIQTGFPFGVYSYGNNLGPKFLGVPWLIGTNWAVLVFITSSISNYFSNVNIYIKALIGSLLMLSLDILMEQIAPQLGFWEFALKTPPLSNYISWFIIAYIMQIIIQNAKIKENRIFSLNLFTSQMVFFVFLNFANSLI